MTYISNIYRIKEGKLKQVKTWFDTMNTERRIEALVNFVYEDISREMFALFKGKDNHHYLIGLNERTGKGKIVPRDAAVPINREHEAMGKECLEAVSEQGEILIDFKL